MNNSKNFQQLREENIDLGIIGKGFISLYYNENVINHDIDLLKNKKYKVIEIDGDFIFNRNELHFELQNKLKFPDYGNCFDALDDYLIDFEINKKGEGIYAVIDMQSEPAPVKELDRQLNLNESVLRTKVVRPE